MRVLEITHDKGTSFVVGFRGHPSLEVGLILGKAKHRPFGDGWEWACLYPQDQFLLLGYAKKEADKRWR